MRTYAASNCLFRNLYCEPSIVEARNCVLRQTTEFTHILMTLFIPAKTRSMFDNVHCVNVNKASRFMKKNQYWTVLGSILTYYTCLVVTHFHKKKGIVEKRQNMTELNITKRQKFCLYVIIIIVLQTKMDLGLVSVYSGASGASH